MAQLELECWNNLQMRTLGIPSGQRTLPPKTKGPEDTQILIDSSHLRICEPHLGTAARGPYD
jgi:hypothetical protein